MQPEPPQSAASASRSREALGLSAVIFVNLLWAMSFPATAIAVRTIPSILLTLIRLGVATLVLSPWWWFGGGRRLWNKRILLLAAFLGVMGFTFPVFLETDGLRLSSPAIAAIAIAMEPLFTTVLSAIASRERLPLRRWLALLLALIGAYAIAGFPRPGNPGYLAGDLLMMLAVMCYAIYNVYSKRLTDKVDSMPAAASALTFGFLGTIPLWFLAGQPLVRVWTSAGIFSTGYLALLSTAGAYVLWNLILRVFHVSFAALFLYMQPVFGVLLSVLIVHVAPEWYFYIGAVIILFSIFLGRTKREETTQ
ncbi:MAG: DMT family transporter [Alicyclobacillaceae bacterium]|jgi:drug/metabolite transporter (DMT)-like permease|uniref:DMT family transporter n=1 Tax=Alicyclobacillus sp. SP_1 TaxID=2942475 RepID=UPI0021589A93|nr:DMT family transporter [Alicyclobacillus sp. SP_1]MCY0887965.1 DMT family transporter [Alicyclobacillaceae bacterium]MCY0896596.1 DMT family transporter [Alicyclobacillaceae bacterium]